MPASRETVADLFRQIQALGRSTKAIAGREPFEGLRLGSALLLSYIESVGEVRSSVLAEHLGLDTSVVSRQIGLLEGLGLTARRPDPADGRAWLSHITPAGQVFLGELRVARMEAVQQALAGWSEDEAKSLVAQLSRLETDLTRATSHHPHNPRPHRRTVTVDGHGSTESVTYSSANTQGKVST